MNSNEMLRKLSAGRVGHYSGFFPPEVLLGFARYCAARARKHVGAAQGECKSAAEAALRVAERALRQMEASAPHRVTYCHLCRLAYDAADAAAIAAQFAGEQMDYARAYDERKVLGRWLLRRTPK